MAKKNNKQDPTGKKKNWFQKHFVTLLIVGALIIGLAIMLYPTISDYWNSFHQSRAIMTYMEDVASMDEENYQEVIASAREYNQEISDHGIKWEMTEEEKADYEKELSTSRTGIMGYLQIEKIDLMLPIYHGIEEKVLQTSIGHIAGTSLPVGCEALTVRQVSWKIRMKATISYYPVTAGSRVPSCLQTWTSW